MRQNYLSLNRSAVGNCVAAICEIVSRLSFTGIEKKDIHEPTDRIPRILHTYQVRPGAPFLRNGAPGRRGALKIREDS